MRKTFALLLIDVLAAALGATKGEWMAVVVQPKRADQMQTAAAKFRRLPSSRARTIAELAWIRRTVAAMGDL